MGTFTQKLAPRRPRVTNVRSAHGFNRKKSSRAASLSQSMTQRSPALWPKTTPTFLPSNWRKKCGVRVSCDLSTGHAFTKHFLPSHGTIGALSQEAIHAADRGLIFGRTNMTAKHRCARPAKRSTLKIFD